MKMNLKEMLTEMIKKKASDLHLRVGLVPMVRVDGLLQEIDSNTLSLDDIEKLADQILNQNQKQKFLAKNEIDLALSVSGMGRFRVNFYRQRGTVGIAMRWVRLDISSFEELNLPTAIKTLAKNKRGLIILTGTTGSGKSTTLAAIIDEINKSRRENILTVEDPIEFMFRNKKSIICQREIGGDTESFVTALRQAFRQDPDVICRIISFYPPHQHQQIRMLLAATLKSIVCQRLLPRCDGPGRVPAVEVLINTVSVREYIMDPLKTPLIPELIESGAIQYGMQSFDQSIMDLYKRGLISYEEAMSQATNPDDFDLRLKGITGASDRGWQEFDLAKQKKKG